MGSIASGEGDGGAGDLKGTTTPSLFNGDGTAGRGAAPSRPIIQICAAPFHTTFVRQCLFFYAQLPQLAPLVALGCRRTAPHTRVSPRVCGRRRGVEGQRLTPGGRINTSPGQRFSASNSRAVDPPRRSFSSAIFVSGESAMRSLETWQNTVALRKRGSGVVGLSPRKVAEKRYAPVRKVCDCKLWVRCEASRPEKCGAGN